MASRFIPTCWICDKAITLENCAIDEYGKGVHAECYTAKLTGVPKVRILVVEDYMLFRRFISAALGKKRDLQIICEVGDGLEAVKKAEELKPDLILLDIGLPTLNGLDVAREIRRRVPESKIIFLTSECGALAVQEAITLGAWGYVVKAMAGSDLLAALEAVISGKQFVSGALSELHLSPALTSTQP